MLGSGTFVRSGLVAIRLRSTTGVLECLNIESWQNPNSNLLIGIDAMKSTHPFGNTDYHDIRCNVLNAIQQIQINALNDRIKLLEDWIAALEPLAQHSGQSDTREWHGVGAGWLYSSHVVYLGEAKP